MEFESFDLDEEIFQFRELKTKKTSKTRTRTVCTENGKEVACESDPIEIIIVCSAVLVIAIILIIMGGTKCCKKKFRCARIMGQKGCKKCTKREGGKLKCCGRTLAESESEDDDDEKKKMKAGGKDKLEIQDLSGMTNTSATPQ